MTVKESNMGKAGTITNKSGQTLKGRVSSVGYSTFYFQIDGLSTKNTFKNEEWDFTPDRPRFEDNTIVSRASIYPAVKVGGDWYQVQNALTDGPSLRKMTTKQAEELEARILDGRLNAFYRGKPVNV